MADKEQTTTSGHDQPWGTSAHGDAERAARSAGTGTGVGGASLAGTPAGPEHEEPHPEQDEAPKTNKSGAREEFSENAESLV